MSTDSIDLKTLTLQVYTENKVILDTLKNTTVNSKVPKANEFLQDQNSKDNKIKRPPNSYIIFSVLLNKYGLLDIIRKFCDNHKINKQKLVPISKIISKNLWNELSIEHKNIYSNLAVEVEKEHKKLYPDYNYQPMRKKIKSVHYKHYEHIKSKIKPADHVSSYMNNTPAHMPVTSQVVNDEFEQKDDDIYDSYDDSYDESSYGGSYVSYTDCEDLNSFDDDLPTFSTHTKLSTLSNSTYYEMQDESYSNFSTSFNHPQQTNNFKSSFNDINNPVNRLACYLCGQLGHVLLAQLVTQEGEESYSIFWNDALETRLCELYMKDDVVDIFWGQPVEESIKGITNWQVYVVTRGLHNSYAKTETITDNQVINFIAEEEKLISFDDPLPNSIKIPQDLEERFDEALDNELGLSFREKHYNLVGIGTGYKRTKGQLTNIPAIILYVRQKGILRRGCDGIFPEEIRGFSVDVVEACVATPCASFDVDYCRRYQGDVKLGSSIGIGSNETLNTTGTLSAVACEKNSNRFGIISCEHVLKFNESDFENGITVYQPSYKDLFEPKRKLDELCKLSKEPGINKDDYESIMYEIEHEENKLKRAKEKNSTLATYVNGMRKNFFSVKHRKYYGIDAGFCVFDNENRTLCPKKFSVPSMDFPTCLEGTYDLNDINNLKDLNPKTEIFKVGRTTGLTFGYLFPASQTIACSLTVESIKIAKKLAMEKHIPFYDNLDQETFIGYMKSHVDSEICQKRKKCYPIEWFDRQLAFLFKPGEFECGDSGASVVDKKGKALGILHAKLKTPNQTFAIASPYFAIIEALNVDICFSPDSITLTATSSLSSFSSLSSISSSSSSSRYPLTVTKV
ncbi:uncharacterized protein OCT59_019815 [Rhizophagus irregularis]|uniref:uncharacterized protein n=1 Tax=Rhizophagus irregularis TaxID=588596 RepID=UPI0033311C22|nr:hypothetical protein OCT59_019815 [Rhizophagus irregularis]